MWNVIKKIYRGMDSIRRLIFNLLFWGLLLIAFIAIVETSAEVDDNSVLILNPSGNIVDSVSSVSLTSLASGSSASSETRLRDITRAIKTAADDEKIKALYTNFDNIKNIGYASIQEILESIRYFKSRGKMVYSYSSAYDLKRYYLSVEADEIWVDYMGGVELSGPSIYRFYLKETMEKFGVDVNVFKAGTYKSAAEVYTEYFMSEGMKDHNKKLLNSLWGDVVKNISESRKLSREQVHYYSNNPDILYEKYGRSGYLSAMDEGFADKMKDRFDAEDFLTGDLGYTPVGFQTYLEARDTLFSVQNIALITIEGTITDSSSRAGDVSADQVIAMIKQAKSNKAVKAFVFRVNSGGGGVYASERIRKAILRVKKEGYPVVVSMGDYAASGGYWLSTPANLIFANNSTITGSIGVYGVINTYQDTLKKYAGVNNDGVTLGEYSEATSSFRKISDRNRKYFQASVEKTYNQFLTIVSQARNKHISVIDRLAQGQVWTGVQAGSFELIDRLGTLDNAIVAAAELAGLDRYDIYDVQPMESLQQSLFSSFFAAVKAESTSPVIDRAEEIMEEVNVFERINDPGNLYVLWSGNL